MNSKEALDNWYNTESPRTKAYEYELHYRLIKKDLEILEFIKTHYEMNGFNELIPKYDEVDKFSELEE